MLVRKCAGGVVFSGDKVFLLKNGNGEWVLPKKVMGNGELTNEAALKQVNDEAGIAAEIVSTAGQTNYDFSSVTRQKPVCDKITWYIMKSPSDKYTITKRDEFTEGGFFKLDEAINLITCNQDKSLLHLSYKKFKELA